ncbi:MAG: DUF4347 domain-containing protein [Nitrospiraceae bacterium]|nr:DUF4347 domain-containing protein [Nitrospiraceae bacterium]
MKKPIQTGQPSKMPQAQGPTPPQRQGLKQSLLSLEPRLMFDAAAAATASEIATEQVAQEQADAAVSSDATVESGSHDQADGQDLLQAISTFMPAESRTEVVFVDPTVPNYQELLSGMDPNIEVVMLDSGQDGVEQIANTLSGRSGIDAVHLISHGNAGELHLGTGTLTAESMSGRYADELATIQHSLSEQADILVYGCDFAKGEAGQLAVDRLADMTGADVEASNDLTGHISLGGDWDFEVKTGAIETKLLPTDEAQMNWTGLLGTQTVRDQFTGTSYSNNDGTQSWSTSWSETDADGGGAGGGDVRVNSGQLRIDTDTVGNAISRGVNLSGATSATLTFDYSNTLTESDRVEARVSNDGGATYRTLSGGVFSSRLLTGSGSASFDISGYASANTRIQFIVTGTGGSDRLYVDNVQVSYDTGSTNTAPVITSNSGGATASITVAENTTTVTTVTTSDANAGQTMTYSISGGADAAKFTINSSTGELSFATAPNYESPTDAGGNNIYDVTVQVSDGNGGTDTQAIAVTVGNINESPTDIVQSTGTGIDLNTDGGNNSYLYTTNGGAILGGRTAFSIEAQFSSSNTPVNGEHRVLLSYATTGSDNEVRVGIAQTAPSTCQLTLTINGSRVDLSGYDASRLFDGGQHHLGATWSATNGGYSFYVDGHQVGTGTGLQTGYTTRSSGTVVVGMDQDRVGGGFQTNQVFKGTLQDVRVFNDVRTAAEISAYLYQDVSNSESGLVADWTMNDLSGGSTSDTVAGRNLTVGSVSGSGWVASTPSLTWRVTENASNGTVVGTVTGTDPDSGDTKTYSLTDTAGGRFAINSSIGQITVADGTLLNYESAMSHTVTVRVTDSGGSSYDEAFTIRLTNVNEAPTDLSLSANSVAENASTGTVVGTVTGTDVDTGDTKTYSLTDTAGGRFAINPSTGQITVANGNLLNYESAASHPVIVQVTDAAGLTYNETFTINLTNVNEAPTDLALSANTIAENATNGTMVGTITGTDPDSGDTKSYSLTDTAGGRFAINSSTGQITVADGSLLNYEAAANHSVTVRVTDSGGLTYDETFTINLTNVNEAPTDLSLSANSVAENASTGTVVGTVTGTDVDTGDTKTYSLTDTAGGRFAINSSTGQLTVADGSLLNYEQAASHSVIVQVTDAAGLTYNEAFTINLTNVNEAPTDLSLSANSVAENASTGTVVGTVTGTDVDTGDTKTYSLTDTAGGRFAINSSTGQITVANSSLLNYEQAASHPVIVQVTDAAGLTYNEAFMINLTNVNEAPTGADATVTMNEDTSHALTATNFGFSDVDAGDSLSAVRIDSLPTSGTLQLSGVDVTAGQVIAVADITAGNLVFTPAADANGTGYASFTFSVRDSNNAYNAAPNQLTFDVTPVNDTPIAGNDSYSIQEDGTLTVDASSGLLATDMEIDGDVSTVILVNGPSNGTLHLSADGSFVYRPNANFSGTDTFAYKVNDGMVDSNVASVTITVSPVNDGPTLTTNSGSTVSEGGADTIDTNELTVTDVDNAAAQLTYSVGTGPAHGRLEFTTAPGVSVTTFSQADIAANRLTYVHDGSETTNDSFTFTVSDGAGGTIGSTTLTLTIAPVNDAPTIVSGGGGAHATYNVAENVSAVTIVTGADVDLPAQALTYSVSGGIDQALFTIDINTGALSFVVPPDFEVPVDADGNNIYVVQVRVTDSQGATTTQTIQVTVTNVAERVTPPSNNPPLPPSFVPTAQPGLPPPGTPLSGGLTPTPLTSTVGEPTVTSPHNSEVPSAPTGFTLEDPRRTNERVKDFAMPQWDTIPDPTPLPIVPIEIADPRNSEEPNPSEPAGEIPLEQLDAIADSLEEAIGVDQERDDLVARITAWTGSTLSSGFVGLALRSSVLLAGCLATMPAWKRFATPSSRRREPARMEPPKTQRSRSPARPK